MRFLYIHTYGGVQSTRLEPQAKLWVGQQIENLFDFARVCWDWLWGGKNREKYPDLLRIYGIDAGDLFSNKKPVHIFEFAGVFLMLALRFFFESQSFCLSLMYHKIFARRRIHMKFKEQKGDNVILFNWQSKLLIGKYLEI